MKNISKDKYSIYLFNAYSNLNSNINFISGSDRVGLELIKMESAPVIIIGPKEFKKFVKSDDVFIESDSSSFNNLFLRYLLRTLKTIFILKKVSQDFNILKIISTSDFFPDVIPSFLYSKKFKWYAFTYHLYPSAITLRNILGGALQKFSYILFKSSFKILTTSSECDNLLTQKFKLSNVQRIKLGIDLTKYENSFEKNGELVFVGRIKKSKGVYDLPEIISIIKKTLPNIRLNIIGNGSKLEIEKLNNLISKFKVSDNIVILPNLSDSEVIDYLKNSSILLQPSYEEGFGLSVLEALAANTRVVLYKLDVYEENFKEFKVHYVLLGDLKGFASTVIPLTSLPILSYPRNLFNQFSWGFIFKNIFFD